MRERTASFDSKRPLICDLGVALRSRPCSLRSIYPNLTTIQIQLRSVPPYVVGAFVTLLLPFLSWKTRQRALYMAIAAPFVMLGYAIFLGSNDP